MKQIDLKNGIYSFMNCHKEIEEVVIFDGKIVKPIPTNFEQINEDSRGISLSVKIPTPIPPLFYFDKNIKT